MGLHDFEMDVTMGGQIQTNFGVRPPEHTPDE